MGQRYNFIDELIAENKAEQYVSADGYRKGVRTTCKVVFRGNEYEKGEDLMPPVFTDLYYDERDKAYLNFLKELCCDLIKK